MKGIVKTVITLAVIGAALYVTNPTIADFGSYYEKQQVAASQKGAPELLKQFAKAVAQTGADLVVKAGFRRDNNVLYSTFTLGPDSKPSARYLGFAKFVFIKL
ncbi:MAG: hypothetical protein KKA67_02465 [Spirochaetes bacterium]|nr:hypothetical protein [Spirochaetota bacterium]MBU1082106.1 hypothetical protein [Spirochaetota bacterium]